MKVHSLLRALYLKPAHEFRKIWKNSKDSVRDDAYFKWNCRHSNQILPLTRSHNLLRITWANFWSSIFITSYRTWKHCPKNIITQNYPALNQEIAWSWNQLFFWFQDPVISWFSFISKGVGMFSTLMQSNGKNMFETKTKVFICSWKMTRSCL